ncbi:MAG TPA: hypothetical protein ENI95_14935 [Chloroflexi bacterium]|nr:hypothetical protein [Chloroflexota bacterium]
MDRNTRGSSPSLRGLVIIGSGAGAAGCLTPILLVGAILVGRQLDKMFGTAPVILLALIFTSIPVSLFLAARSALDAGRAVQEEQARALATHPHDEPFNRHSSDSFMEDSS